MGSADQSKTALNSDIIHNRNCHAYLFYLKPYINKHITQDYLTPIAQVTKDYDETFAYGDLYSSALTALEDQIDKLYPPKNTPPTLTPEQTKALDKLILAIYHNDNEILEHGKWINDLVTSTRPKQIDTSKHIEDELREKSTTINKVFPTQTETLASRFNALFAANYKPQLGTNLPSLKNYSYRKNSNPTEYRFSTQAQRHNSNVRISPLFIRWLKIKAKLNPDSRNISHIYFNNLGLDRGGFDIPGVNERHFSLALQNLEKDASLNIAVITLPASKSLMGTDHYQSTEQNSTYDSVYNELLQVAHGKGHKSGVADLDISYAIRRRIFGPERDEVQTLRALLTDSFNALGIKPYNKLSKSQTQAVWMYFIKFELTDYIITQLKPNGYNFSCKDAIDRGAVSSTYYNLIKSFKLNKPIQKEEFERALDSAAANVKGRGMNFHRTIIWNALDGYVNANHDVFISDAKKSWLIFWRDMNCPHSRVNELLKARISECKKQLDALPDSKNILKGRGRNLLSTIEKLHLEQVSGQRLLLELVARTSQLLSPEPPPKPEDIHLYKNLAQEIQIKYPGLYVLAGLIEVFLGALLFIPTLSYSKGLITHGISNCKSGFFMAEREQVGKDIEGFSSDCDSKQP